MRHLWLSLILLAVNCLGLPLNAMAQNAPTWDLPQQNNVVQAPKDVPQSQPQKEPEIQLDPSLRSYEAAPKPVVKPKITPPKPNATQPVEPIVPVPNVQIAPPINQITPPIATTPPPPKAPSKQSLVAKVSIKKQTITITLNNEMIYKWAVSTGRKGFETPPGSYTGQRKYTLWRSRTYDNAPMPFAVFFYAGYAVHGTTALSNLGRPASHGCVRVSTPHAKVFYDLVDEVGLTNTRVIVTED